MIAAALDAGIGFQLDAAAHAGLFGLGRQIDALTGDVVFPAVIGAAQPAFLVAAEPQRDAAMGAEFVDEADAVFGIAEGDELLAQQLHPHRRTIRRRQLVGAQRRKPVAPHEIAHRRARAHFGQNLIVFARRRHIGYLRKM